MKQKYIESGKFVGTHGVRGTLRVQPWCDTPDFLCQFKRLYLKSGENFDQIKIKSSKVHGNVVLMDVEGITTIELAETLRGRVLFVSREDFKLEEGAYLICDLLGCKVFDFDSEKFLGEICDVSKTGANDVWHIKNNGKEYLIPVIPDVVKEVDVMSEKVLITPLPGIFDEIEEIKE
ncbi:MAG: 16S rRNA processing protein RimM [Clostridia bacterium]|nr:16S rRNA processing protein RimM [Clostridia bacterium]